ncbi:MAG: hypothetical protein IJW77_16080 [Clostridia bacterium]|nr:hypothetical protein [Clostridia bacterium]
MKRFALMLLTVLLCSCTAHSGLSVQDTETAAVTESVMMETETVQTTDVVTESLTEEYDLDNEEDVIKWWQAWEKEWYPQFTLDALPETFTLCVSANVYPGYQLYAGSDPTEPHGIALYLTNTDNVWTGTVEASQGFRKCTIELPEDIEYDRIEYWPAILSADSSCVCYLGLKIFHGDICRSTVFTALFSDEYDKGYHFTYAYEYPASDAENIAIRDDGMIVYKTYIDTPNGEKKKE